MTKQKSTKKTLLTSVLSLVVCMAMLIGTTFAWFTDSVTSNNNIIKSGNLDAELYWSTDASNWEKVVETTNVFDQNALWEPGHTEVIYLKVVNEGSLALKYQLGVNVVSETLGTNIDGEIFKLSNYIKYGVIETEQTFESREAARAAVSDAKVISAGFSKGATLENKNDADVMSMVVYMPENVGNEANHKTGTTAPEIKIGINLVATQFTYENDSFGNDYDKDALPCDVIATPDTINDVLSNVEAGTVIGLADGKYGSIVLTQNNLTLVSNSAVVDYINLNAKDNCKLIGITFDAAGAQPAYEMTKTAGVNKAKGFNANIVAAENSANGADNTQIINCIFTGTPSDGSKYVPVCFAERNRKSGGTKGFTVEECNFETDAAYYVYANYPAAGEYMIRNNAFGTANGNSENAVYIGATQGNVSVLENTFVDGSAIVTPHNNESCTYALKVSVIGNNFVNTTNDEMAAIGLRAFGQLAKCNVVVADNIANYGYSTLTSYTSEPWDFYAVAGGVVSGVIDNAGIESALTADKENIVVVLANDVTYDVAAWATDAMGGASTKDIVINGNGHTITFNQKDSDWNNIVTNGARLIINDAKITNSGYNNGPWNRHDLNFGCDVELNNVTSDKALAFKAAATLKNVTINDANTSDTYAIWIQSNGQTVDIDGLVIDMLACTDGRGIKIDNQYVDATDEKAVTLNIKNATFKTEEKSAILVKSTKGATIYAENLDISSVSADSVNAVWVDEAVSASYDKVTVYGASVIIEP